MNLLLEVTTVLSSHGEAHMAFMTRAHPEPQELLHPHRHCLAESGRVRAAERRVVQPHGGCRRSAAQRHRQGGPVVAEDGGKDGGEDGLRMLNKRWWLMMLSDGSWW